MEYIIMFHSELASLQMRQESANFGPHACVWYYVALTQNTFNHRIKKAHVSLLYVSYIIVHQSTVSRTQNTGWGTIESPNGMSRQSSAIATGHFQYKVFDQIHASSRPPRSCSPAGGTSDSSGLSSCSFPLLDVVIATGSKASKHIPNSLYNNKFTVILSPESLLIEIPNSADASDAQYRTCYMLLFFWTI